MLLMDAAIQRFVSAMLLANRPAGAQAGVPVPQTSLLAGEGACGPQLQKTD
jgi:hypothetical protein